MIRCSNLKIHILMKYNNSNKALKIKLLSYKNKMYNYIRIVSSLELKILKLPKKFNNPTKDSLKKSK